MGRFARPPKQNPSLPASSCGVQGQCCRTLAVELRLALEAFDLHLEMGQLSRAPSRMGLREKHLLFVKNVISFKRLPTARHRLKARLLPVSHVPGIPPRSPPVALQRRLGRAPAPGVAASGWTQRGVASGVSWLDRSCSKTTVEQRDLVHWYNML